VGKQMYVGNLAMVVQQETLGSKVSSQMDGSGMQYNYYVMLRHKSL
jgi:hypothetical protein